ncbi:MAG: hypothetical protein COB04_19080 [Gammaproteobacteria bacterium]|nr:MAG: hypothetical protein COB04_19080 [Gammaproteobacteria bacterium]
MAASPEESDFTSIQERLYLHAKRVAKPYKVRKKLLKAYKICDEDKGNGKGGKVKLKPLNGSCHAPLSKGLPFTQQDYFKRVDWTGKVVRKDKRVPSKGSYRRF